MEACPADELLTGSMDFLLDVFGEESNEIRETEAWQPRQSRQTKRKGTQRKNSDACRRSREKRRRENVSLRNRVLQLDDEVRALRVRIAELQTEAQTLQHGGGEADLAAQNALLRAEICEHKAQIRAIVAATRDESSALEHAQRRALHVATDHAVGQVRGLLHASALWRVADEVDLGGNCAATVYFQLLPAGASVASAVRLNLRFDMHLPGAQVEDVDRTLWDLYAECDRKTPDGKLRRCVGFDIAESNVVQAFAQETGKHVSFVRYVESEAPQDSTDTLPVKESLHLLVRSEEHLPSFRFAPTKACASASINAADASRPCHVLATASFGRALADTLSAPEPGGHTARLRESMIKGQVTFATEDGGCQCISIGSYPVGFFDSFPSATEFFDEDGAVQAPLQLGLVGLHAFLSARKGD